MTFRSVSQVVDYRMYVLLGWLSLILVWCPDEWNRFRFLSSSRQFNCWYRLVLPVVTGIQYLLIIIVTSSVEPRLFGHQETPILRVSFMTRLDLPCDDSSRRHKPTTIKSWPTLDWYAHRLFLNEKIISLLPVVLASSTLPLMILFVVVGIVVIYVFIYILLFFLF
jgi:hypothetical protein